MAHTPLVGVGSTTPAPATQPAMSEQSASDRLATFIERLEVALNDRVISERLASAKTVVRIELLDLPGHGVTLGLDEAPATVRAAPPTEPAEVQLWMTSADLDALASEDVFLPIKITSGEVRYEGFVRKFLRVIPILRDALNGDGRA
jgi:hypothetical protein